MSSAAQALFAPHALLPQGWAQDVLLPWDGTGRLAEVSTGAPPPAHCCRPCPTCIRTPSSAASPA